MGEASFCQFNVSKLGTRVNIEVFVKSELPSGEKAQNELWIRLAVESVGM